MFSTLARRTSSNSGGASRTSASRRSKNTPSRRPASVVSSASKPPACSTPCTTTRARQDQVGARGLDARHARALGRGQRRQPLDQLLERVALDDHPLHAVGRQAGRALGGGGEVAHGAADAHQAPAATLARASSREPRRLARAARRRARAAPPAACAWPGRWAAGSARSCAPCRAATSPSCAISRSATRTSCSEPPPRSSTQPSRSVVELTAAR